MSTTIKYLNLFGSPVTVAQAETSLNYTKLIFENQILKKREQYNQKSLVLGDYFMSPAESVFNVINQLDNSVSWQLYSDEQIINTYHVWKVRTLTNGVLSSSYGKEVFDSFGRMIALHDFDGNNARTGMAIKTFYFGNEPIIHDGITEGTWEPDSKVSFYFNLDGTVKHIIPSTGEFDEPFYSIASFTDEDTNGPILALMTAGQLAYYTSSDPLIPNF